MRWRDTPVGCLIGEGQTTSGDHTPLYIYPRVRAVGFRMTPFGVLSRPLPVAERAQ